MKKGLIRRPISTAELQRRWEITNNLMADKDVDCILAQGSNMALGGYVRWLTDIPAENNYHMTVLFPKDGQMTLIRSCDIPIPEWALRGVEKVNYLASAPTLNYMGVKEAELVIDYLKKYNVKRLGFVNTAFITAGMMTRIKAALPKLELVDVTDEFDLLKAIKSDEEMECIRETARIHDAVWAALPCIAKPGMYEYQLRAEMIQLLMNLGSEEHLMFIGTAPQGKPCAMPTFQYGNRCMQPGDYGVILMEVSGPGGYYCESARNFSFGAPSKALKDAWDVAREAQQLTADLLIPGNDSTQIVKRYNEFVSSKGYSQEGRLYGHSQGYDLVERPAFMAENPHGVETMRIHANMNCSLHPYFTNDELTVYINDNYFIDENGAARIHKVAPEIIII